MPYDDEFKHCRHLCFSFFKEFGIGNRVMESHILVEVTELVNGAKQISGRSFVPDLLLTSCVLNVLHSILYGTRLDCSGARMTDFVEAIHKTVKSVISILNVFSWLQYLPKYRRHVRQALVELNRLAAIVDAGIYEALSAEKIGKVSLEYILKLNRIAQSWLAFRRIWRWPDQKSSQERCAGV